MIVKLTDEGEEARNYLVSLLGEGENNIYLPEKHKMAIAVKTSETFHALCQKLNISELFVNRRGFPSFSLEILEDLWTINARVDARSFMDRYSNFYTIGRDLR